MDKDIKCFCGWSNKIGENVMDAPLDVQIIQQQFISKKKSDARLAGIIQKRKNPHGCELQITRRSV